MKIKFPRPIKKLCQKRMLKKVKEMEKKDYEEYMLLRKDPKTMTPEECEKRLELLQKGDGAALNLPGMGNKQYKSYATLVWESLD